MAKVKRGLSNAFSTLILAITSIIIAILLVALSFGLSGAISSTPVVTQLGTAYISPTGDGHYELTVTFKVTGGGDLVSVSFDNQNVTFYEKGNVTAPVLYTDVDSLTLCLVPTTAVPQGIYVNLELGFSNGETLLVTAIYLN
ncbi:MAG: hypothetical protein ASUL_02349 [Candidatus Aramenus sulfurataquae]|uniref:Archaeal Type IV pilin N-terminal domain-containing protein n=2 Tax=Candidatus Aramenus sulfurataquae TaxID=1326980 RepID=W7KYJ8_9CREN|nr:MAG: hypothetical protein ASUL_02349 [Candidatus Aramenus sulfurataquae]